MPALGGSLLLSGAGKFAIDSMISKEKPEKV
jgi:hypothetical protein